jgi:peptide/nickel transport system substrate-binding protein
VKYKKTELLRLILLSSFLAAFFLFLVLQTSSVGKENPSYGDAYVSASIANARILIPFLADDSASSSICELIFNGLTKTDKNLQITGDLAQKWQISDDKKEITFYLRKGVKWHDGYPFTAQDVKFTYELILDPKVGCPYYASYSDIEDIKIVDDYTIIFKFKKPYAPALLKLGMGIVPKHLLEGKNIRTSGFSRAPIGTGPYKFKEWKTDEYVILEANQDYFEGRPYIDKYVVRIIPDMAVQYLELLTEAVDSMGLTPYQYKIRSQTEKFEQKINKYKYLAHSYTYIGYNLEDPLFKEKKVREALTLAIDKSEIIQGVLLGLGEPTTGPFLKGTYAYNEEVKDTEYNPRKALELLREAGWYDSDGDGILDKEGRSFKFKLITNQGNKQREDIATIVQRKWKEIGIEVEIQTIAWAAFLDQFVNKKNFQAVILGWTIPTDPDIYNVWHSSSAREGGLNFISYRNEEVDRLIEEGRRIFNIEKRSTIYKKIHAILAKDKPYTFLYIPYATPAVNARFKGIEPAAAGIGYNFIKWYVEPDEQKYTFNQY